MPARYRVLRRLNTDITILGVDIFDFVILVLVWVTIWRFAKVVPSIELARWLIVADVLVCIAAWRIDRAITKRRGVGWLFLADTYNRMIYPKHAFETEAMPRDIAKVLQNADC